MEAQEHNRLTQMLSFEQDAYNRGNRVVAGLDEAGRGPLAGPVVACALIFTTTSYIAGINDSKKLSEKKRNYLFDKLVRHDHVIYGVGIIDEKDIDSINILEATRKAMRTAIGNLSVSPDFLLVDGMTIPDISISQQKIIDGDARSYTIAAASIIAKVVRDNIMSEYDKQYPHYGFAQHKGYGTRQHMDALKKHGPCSIHRKSFAPVAKLIAR